MKKFYQSFFLSRRFFAVGIGIVFLFISGFIISPLFVVSKWVLVLFTCVILADFMLLYFTRGKVIGHRILSDRFSNGDENSVNVVLENKYNFNITIEVIEEVPPQFGDLKITSKDKIPKRETIQFEYYLRPVERGEYVFGNINVFVNSVIGLVSRRCKCGVEDKVKVFPSYVQMRKFEFLAASNRLTEFGVKQIRRIGQNTEFENIRDYFPGDDIRTINWKASARRNDLMVNEYQDERSQPVYCIIDKGRTMKMPFNGMSLLDYAINSSLVFSNIALNKSDKAGLITFSNKIGAVLPADSKTYQMQTILETLYNQETRFQEADYERLYKIVKRVVKRRSLLMLYTNFESMVAVNRHMRFLRKLAKDHVLVVIFFENTELVEMSEEKTSDIESLYEKLTAEKFVYEKKLIVKELKKHGIHSLLTRPEDLTIESINKYLEIKSRGLI